MSHTRTFRIIRHVISRVKERIGVDITTDDYYEMLRLIQENPGDYVTVRATAFIYRFTFQNTCICALYNPATKMIHTAYSEKDIK